MNRLITAFGLLLFLCISLTSGKIFAQEKIVYIDSYRIRLEYKEFQDAQMQFNKEVEQLNAEMDGEEQEIKKMEEDFSKQALILSDVKKKEKETEIEARKEAWKKKANELFGPDGRVERRNAELTKPLLDKINTVLEQIAISEGYLMILDTVNGNIAYAKKELDITDKVLEELEKAQ